MGKDHTLFALTSGTVQFQVKGANKRRKTVEHRTRRQNKPGRGSKSPILR